MQIFMTSTFILFALALPSVAAAAGPCPYDSVQVCAWHGPGHLPRCHCVRQNSPGSPTWHGGGKAEIHKRNVPTAKPTKSPGPND